MNVICFKHPEYQGTTTPVLSCKSCCGIFIAHIKTKNAAGQPVDTSKWLEDKVSEGQRAHEPQRRIAINYGFDPRTV